MNEGKILGALAITASIAACVTGQDPVQEDVGAAYSSDICYAADSPIRQTIDRQYDDCMSGCMQDWAACEGVTSEYVAALNAAWKQTYGDFDPHNLAQEADSAAQCVASVLAHDCGTADDANELVREIAPRLDAAAGQIGIELRIDASAALERAKDLTIDVATCEATVKPIGVAACMATEVLAPTLATAVNTATTALLTGIAPAAAIRDVLVCDLGNWVCEGQDVVIGAWIHYGCEGQRGELFRACQTAPCSYSAGDQEHDPCDGNADGFAGGTWEYTDRPSDDPLSQLRNAFTPDNFALLGWWSTCECIGDGAPTTGTCPSNYCDSVCAGAPAPLCTGAVPTCSCGD